MNVKNGLVLEILFSMFFVLNGHAEVVDREISPSESHLLFDGALAEKEIALTFGGPVKATVLEPILDLLKSEGLRAHFFVTGISAWKNPKLIQRIVDEGHVIGSSSYGLSMVTEADTTFEMKSQKIETEITVGHEMVYAVTGRIMPFIRFQMRHGTLQARRLISNSGVYAFYWNIDCDEDHPAESLKASLEREGWRGMVALNLSENGTLIALATLIREIRNRDLKVILFQPPKLIDWKTRPPLIRDQLLDSVREHGSLNERNAHKQVEI